MLGLTPKEAPMQMPKDLNEAVAIIDSNVMIETVSFHDMDDAFKKTNLADAKHFYRRQRLQDTLVLMEYLHRHRFKTFSLCDEPLRLLEKNVPTGQPSVRSEYVKVALGYLTERIF